jgi:hypothetical protein
VSQKVTATLPVLVCHSVIENNFCSNKFLRNVMSLKINPVLKIFVVH